MNHQEIHAFWNFETVQAARRASQVNWCRASPEVASYPFTTLMPNLGVIKGKEHFEVDEFEEDALVGQRATLADLPGLIQGAHQVSCKTFLAVLCDIQRLLLS